MKYDFTHKVYFYLDSPYKWGDGWTGTQEEQAEMYAHLIMLIMFFGHQWFDGGYGCPEGKALNETSYMHPMELVVGCSRERADEVIKIVKENSFHMYTLKRIEIKNLETKESEWFDEKKK